MKNNKELIDNINKISECLMSINNKSSETITKNMFENKILKDEKLFKTLTVLYEDCNGGKV